MIRFPSEQNNDGRITCSMRRFAQVIDDLELKYIPAQGDPFTWRGGQNNCRMARLDRFLVTEEWDSHFGGIRQKTLPRPTSDHFPILLERGKSLTRGPFPLRFENMWLKEKGFKDLIRV